jgi:hypothetical protein
MHIDVNRQFERYGGSARFAFNVAAATHALADMNDKLLDPANTNYLVRWVGQPGRSQIHGPSGETALSSAYGNDAESLVAAGAGPVSGESAPIPAESMDPSRVEFYQLSRVQFLSAWMFYQILQMVQNT